MREAGDRLTERHHARIAEAQRRGPLARLDGRLLESIERVLRQHTLVAHAFDFEELAIDLVARDPAGARDSGPPWRRRNPSGC